MPTRKLDPIQDFVMYCYDSDHTPSAMTYYTPGLYEHTCPSCKRVVVFKVDEFHYYQVTAL